MTTGLLRMEDVSEQTGVPVNTLRYWRQQGTGPKSAKLGRRVVYRQTDVDAWVNAQFVDAEADRSHLQVVPS